MPRVLIFAALSLLTSAAIASAQEQLPPSLAFPGSFWISAGEVGPAEPGNTVGQAFFEQGISVFRSGPWFVTPFFNASLLADSRGYEWNDRNPVSVGVKLQRRTPGGVIYGGGGIMIERNPATGQRRHASLFSGYWTGWHLDGRSHVGATPFGLPGSLNLVSGLLTGRDPDNWVSYASVQQGVRVYRHFGIAAVPYASLQASIDTKDRPWNNRASADVGFKAVRAIGGASIEAGVAQRIQRQFQSGQQTSEPVTFVNLWVGWNPSATVSR